MPLRLAALALFFVALPAASGQPLPDVDLGGAEAALVLDGRTGALLGTHAEGGYSTLEAHEDGRYVTFGAGVLWQTAPWRRVARLETTALDGLRLSADGARVLAGDVFTGWAVLALPEGTPVRRFSGQGDVLSGFAFSPDGRRFAANGACAVLGCAGAERAVAVYDAKDGALLRTFPIDAPLANADVAFSDDGKWVGAAHAGEGVAAAWSLDGDGAWRAAADKGAEGAAVDAARAPAGLAFLLDLLGGLDASLLPAERFALTGGEGPLVWTRPPGAPDACDALRAGWDGCKSAGDRVVLLNSGARRAVLTDPASDAPLATVPVDAVVSMDEAVRFLYDGRVLLVRQPGSHLLLWADTGAEIARVFASVQNWLVVAPDGRFDTPDPVDPPPVVWVIVEGDAQRRVPVEALLETHYEPGLLGLLLGGVPLPPLPPLTALDGAQPAVALSVVAGAEAGAVAVTVEVAPPPGGARDLRVFRDGRLVASHEGPLRESRYRFDAVALGLSEGPSVRLEGATAADSAAFFFAAAAAFPELEENPAFHEAMGQGDAALIAFLADYAARQGGGYRFTAYAFSAAGLKSPTAEAVYRPEAPVPARRRRAFVISLGVDAFSDPAWDLQYAAADAHRMQDALGRALGGAVDEVVAVPLVAPHGEGGTLATKAALEAVLRALAGEPLPPDLAARLLNADRLDAATPFDLVVVTASTHGFADEGGRFYLFPEDIGPPSGRGVTPERLARAVSSDELAAWLQGVDAAEVALVIDACHAAAAVEGAGFRPGPLAGGGLGRLAYEKGLRVVVASQADDVALESGRLGHGVLTYALAAEGLEAGRADVEPVDGRVFLAEWLRWGEARVPQIVTALRGGDAALLEALGTTAGTGALTPLGDGTRSDVIGAPEAPVQQPTVFDFREGAGPLLAQPEAGVSGGR